MLDQNTDRTWWMIGAVLVGAALVYAANAAYPEVFSSVVTYFKSALTKATNSL